MFQGFVFIHRCIDDLMLLVGGYWNYYLDKLKLIINKLKDN